MSNLLGDSGTSFELSVIKDPFLKDKVKNISINMTQKIFTNTPYWYASVTFQNGNTSGQQKTNDCDTFEQVIAELKQILDSVRNKQ